MQTQKFLYGLKQASRQWFAKLTTELTRQGFTQSKNDYSLFIKHVSTSITIVAVYVDDINLTGDDISAIHRLKHHLHRIFNIKDLGKLNFFLGIEVTYAPIGVMLSQRRFGSNLVQAAGLSSSKGVATPLPVHLKL